MNMIKRIGAALLALLMLGSFCACHKKGEIAVTVEDEKLTSAAYLYYLMGAYADAKSKVDADLSEEEQSSVDYYSKKIDDKSFETWVKDTALENLEKSAAYILLCKKNEVEPDKDQIAQLEEYVNAYWTNPLVWEEYNYSQPAMQDSYEPNGVSKETYLDCAKHAYYQSAYFNYLYGESGTKAPTEKELKAALGENFILADRLDVTFNEETDEEKADIKKELEGYVKALKDGSKTFEEVYHEYNEKKSGTDETTAEGTEETTEAAEAETTGEEADSGELKPKDDHAQLIVSEEVSEKISQYNNGTIITTDYDVVKAMKKNEVKLQEKEDGAGYVLLVRKDVLEDEYYWKSESNDTLLRHLLKDEEMEKEIDAFLKDAKIDVNQSAINRLKVKKLKTETA